MNLLLLSILLTGFSYIASGRIGPEPEAVLNPYIGGALAAIIFSTILAAFTYTASNKRTGLSGRDIKKIVEEQYTLEQNLRGMITGYSEWMQYNFKINTVNAPLGTSILLFLIYGIILLSVGVFHEFVSETGGPTVVIVSLIIGFITWRSGIVGQLKRYWRYRDFDPAKD